jgi:hypothetical protein
MSALITPPIRWPHIPFTLYRSPAAPIERVVTPHAPQIALDLGTVVIVRDEAAPIVVVDLVVEFVAAHAVEERRWRQLGEERGEVGQGEGGRGVCGSVTPESIIVGSGSTAAAASSASSSRRTPRGWRSWVWWWWWWWWVEGYGVEGPARWVKQYLCRILEGMDEMSVQSSFESVTSDVSCVPGMRCPSPSLSIETVVR